MLTAKCPQLHHYTTCDQFDDVTNTFSNNECTIIDTNDEYVTCTCTVVDTNRRRLISSSSVSSSTMSLLFASKKKSKYDIYEHRYMDANRSIVVKNDNSGVSMVSNLLISTYNETNDTTTINRGQY